MATGHPSTDEMIKARGKVDSNCFVFDFLFRCICVRFFLVLRRCTRLKYYHYY